MSRRVVDEVLRLNETHGFLRGLTALVGFPQASVLYDRDPRATGSGKYNRFTGSVRIGLNGIIGFSRYPLQIITWIGLITFAFAMVLALVYLCLRIAGIEIVWGNPTLVIILSFFSGIQLLSLGVIGEYVGRIYDEVKRRPLFVVDALEGFERPMAELEETRTSSRERSPTRRARASRAALPPVAILAGGLGTRLGAAAAGLPKGMVPVAGPPLPRARDGAPGARRRRRGSSSAAATSARPSSAGLGDGGRFGLSIAYSDEGPRADRHGRAPCGGRCRCSASASWSCTATPTCASTTPRSRPRHERSGLAGLMTVLRNRGRWGPSNVVYARGRVRAYDKRSPPPGAEWIDYGLLGADAARRSRATSRPRRRPARPRRARASSRGMPVRARFYEIGTPEALAETGPLPQPAATSRDPAGPRPAASARGRRRPRRRAAPGRGVEGHRGGRARRAASRSIATGVTALGRQRAARRPASGASGSRRAGAP